MAWQTLDFQGIITLDKSLVEQLREYLFDREKQLGVLIVHSIQVLDSEILPPSLPLTSEKGVVKLTDAVQEFSRKLQQIIESRRVPSQPVEWEITASHLNKGLWDHVELLESAAVELFQQVDQVGFECWCDEMANVIELIKKILMQSLQQMVQTIRQLEQGLREYRSFCLSFQRGPLSFFRWIPFQTPILDRSLLKNTVKSEKFLEFRFQTFIHHFEQYDQMHSSVEESLKKFDAYQIFTSLDEEQQSQFKKIYRLLKIWELNRVSKALSQREPTRALRNAIAPEKALQLFKNMTQAMKNALYKRSRYLKKSQGSLDDQMNRLVQQQAVHLEMAELHTLGVTVAKYRDFLLRTDPNPYVRTRWGFTEWIVGPEPTVPKQLRTVEFNIDSLDVLYQCLSKSIVEWEGKRKIIPELNEDIQRILHEMGQPLTSHSMMQVRAEHFLSLLTKINELGSCDFESVEYTGQALSRAMRADWKHHVLYDIPTFHELYEIHQGIVGQIEDRAHLNRSLKFKRYLQQIQQWVKEKNLQNHAHEIEFDMNDIKVYLQDFLAYVQRMNRDLANNSKEMAKPVIENISHQLLEYRYLFGNFFHHLRERDAEEKLMRHQFLFVDQYFESVESRLHDMRTFP